MSNKNKKRNAARKAAAQQVAAKRAAERVAAAKAAKAARRLPKHTKITIALIAVLCVLSILLGTSGGMLIARKVGHEPYESIYDTIRIKDYMTLAETQYKNAVFNMSSVSKPVYTESDMDDYVSIYLPYAKRELIKKAQKNTVIGYGDDISFYVVSVTEDGKPILTSDFAAYSYSTSAMTVGSASIPQKFTSLAQKNGLLISAFGKDFDRVLVEQGVKPADTLRETRANGTISADDVLIVSYAVYSGTAKKNPAEGEDPYQWSAVGQAITSARMDLSEQPAELREAILAAFADTENKKTFGEKLELILKDYVLPENRVEEGAVDKNGNPVPQPTPGVYKYEMYVSAVVTEEKTVEVEFTVPDGLFEGMGEEYTSLVGKTITFHIIIESMDDYETATVDGAFLKEKMEFETDKTADADIIAAYKAETLTRMNEESEENYRQTVISNIYYTLKNSKAQYSGDYPDELYAETFQAAVNELSTLYYSYYGVEPSSADALNALTYELTGGQFNSYQTYCDSMVLGEIYEYMIAFVIYQKQKLSITTEEIEAAYREYIDGLVETYDDEAYNEEYFVKLYGKDEIYKQVRMDLIHELVGNWLFENNTIKGPSTDA